MNAICFFFQVHQPLKLNTYRFFDIGYHKPYFDDYSTGYYLQQLAEKSYLPANRLLGELIKKHGNKFKVSFNISGVALELFEHYTPDVLDSFKGLAKTGNVEFLVSPYSHGLVSLKSKDEFLRQVTRHEQKLISLFGFKPKAFANTELIYNDEIAKEVYGLGYKTILLEGAKQVLGWKSPNLLYCSSINPKVKLLLRNFQLSDDIGFRFCEKSWSEWPLTAEKFTGWIKSMEAKAEVVNLFLNYQTFGDRISLNSGIFEFLKELPRQIFKKTNFTFKTPSEVAETLQPAFTINTLYPISWADEERDITPWLGNEMQIEAHNKLFGIEAMINSLDDNELTGEWYRLQSCDYFYEMSTKWTSDGFDNRYSNSYINTSPYNVFINYMNILSDFEIKVKKAYSLKETEMDLI